VSWIEDFVNLSVLWICYCKSELNNEFEFGNQILELKFPNSGF